MDYNNFFRVLQNAKIKEGASLSRTEADMRAGKSGMILYEQLGTSRYAYYCPLGMNGWTVVNIVSKEAITAKTDLLTRNWQRSVLQPGSCSWHFSQQRLYCGRYPRARDMRQRQSQSFLLISAMRYGPP